MLAGVLLLTRYGVPLLPAPDKPAEVELLMVEQKGAGHTTPPPSAAPTQNNTATPQPASPPPPSPPGESRTSTAPPPPPVDKQAEEMQPVPPEPPDQPTAATRPAAAPAHDEAPTPPAPLPSTAHAASAAPPAPPAIAFNLGGTDSQSNALASGDGVIPASPDNRHRNRPPVYPDEAALRGEQGAVVLLIHVSPSGLPATVDVMESSGHASLDHAALQAVKTWRFVPAVKDGTAVSFDMPMRFVFSFN